MTTILLIEDNDAILDNLTEFLELEGFAVLSAKNGKKGIELAKLYRPRLIICDVLMPEMDGYEVLRRLLDTTITNETAFIFSTSKCETSDQKAAIKLGADGLIAKPFELESLLTIANEFIKSGSLRLC
jgi:DNA-binding response OmpR family regulator